MKLYKTILLGIFGAIFTIITLFLMCSFTLSFILSATIESLPTTTNVFHTIDDPPTFVAQSEPVPFQIQITNFQVDDQGKTIKGTGYFAPSGNSIRVFTALHVIKTHYLIFQGNGINSVGHFDYSCVITPEDGSCQIFQEGVSYTNIVRDVSRVPEEVSIYNRELLVWMPFLVIDINDQSFIAQGLPLDLDNDSIPDLISQVCRGMSGSPAMESHNGVLALNQNHRLISRGEVSSIYDYDSTDPNCSSIVEIVNPAFTS